jgi:hypothetical protein
MRKTSLYSLVFLIALFSFLFLQNKEKLIKPINPTQQIVQKTSNTKSKPKRRISTKTDIDINESETIIETTIFSDDPFIDQHIMKHKFRYCINQVNIDTDKKDKTKQEKMLHKYNLYCNKIMKKHPEFRLADKHWNDTSKKPVPNSYLGKLFSDNEFYKSPDYDIKRIIKEVKNISPDLLLAEQYIFMFEYMMNTNHSLMEILQSHQLDYVSTIANYAQDLYACRNGADCGQNSTLMLTHCMKNKNFCMSDYELLIKTKLTQGQQADVVLAYKFYEKFFTVD